MAICFGQKALLGRDLYPTHSEIFCHLEKGQGNESFKELQGVMFFSPVGVSIFCGTIIILYHVVLPGRLCKKCCLV